LFRVFLYVMLFAFPLGTMVSYVTLRYISRDQIRQYYGLPVEARDSPPSGVCGLASSGYWPDDRAIPLDVAQLLKFRRSSALST
jgi:hypothetical protein